MFTDELISFKLIYMLSWSLAFLAATEDQMKCTNNLSKDFSWSIWENVRIYIINVVFTHFNSEILHIVPLETFEKRHREDKISVMTMTWSCRTAEQNQYRKRLYTEKSQFFQKKTTKWPTVMKNLKYLSDWNHSTCGIKSLLMAVWTYNTYII